MNPRTDGAVSPVIAVILMVAITVVLAAVVYVWVSGFSASGGTPSASLSLAQSGQMVTNDTQAAAECGAAAATWCASWTITSSTTGLKLGRVSVRDHDTATGTVVCAIGGDVSDDAVFNAGQTLACYSTTGTDPVSGDKFSFTDTEANSVMLSLSVR